MNPQRISMVTLSVENLDIARKFYADLGFEEAEGGNEKIAFYKLAGQYFSLYSKGALEGDLDIKIPRPATGSVSLAINFDTREAVDAAFAKALKAGATVISTPEEVFWGGYSGTFADPDGHLWEVAQNPFWTLDENGQIIFE